MDELIKVVEESTNDDRSLERVDLAFLEVARIKRSVLVEHERHRSAAMLR